MKTRDLAAYAALILGAVFTAAPFILLVSLSFMKYEQTIAYPPEWIPNPPVLENYIKALTDTPLLSYFLTSLIVAAAQVLGHIATGSMAGYAFARFAFRGRNALFFMTLTTMMVPIYVNLVPLYAMMAMLGWVDTYAALIVPGLTGAFGIFLFRQWFLSLPADIEDAARIDGASPWDIYWRIALPTALPAIATLGIFEFLASWNTFLWPLMVTHSDATRTLPVGLAAFRSSMKEVTNWGLLMAATAISVLPAIAVFLVGQKYFLKGLLEGALKE